MKNLENRLAKLETVIEKRFNPTKNFCRIYVNENGIPRLIKEYPIPCNKSNKDFNLIFNKEILGNEKF